MLVACKEKMTAILLPPQLLRMILKRKLTWKLVLGYLKHFKKFNSSFLRIKFMRKCLDNDIISDFLRFRVPDNGVFFLSSGAQLPTETLEIRAKPGKCG